MNETFLALLTAHLVADFPLQPDWTIRRKKRASVLALHMAAVIAVAIAALGAWPPELLLILLTTHLIADVVKTRALTDSLQSFAADQAVHLCVLLGLAVLFPQTVAQGWWPSLAGERLNIYFAGLCLLSGLIVGLNVGAIVIQKATAPFAAQMGGEIVGLENGGLYIGWLERALVMLLVLANQAGSVGFMIAAKSIFRFGEHKSAEYIIIGTFMSFGWGLLAASLTLQAIKHWLPV
ncbi:MAG: DUF3307 domain-containing protein [Roseiarcus sp.]|jgi:hypothetical protein